MLKKIIFVVFIFGGIFGFVFSYFKSVNFSDASKFKAEYERYNGKKNDFFQYRNLSIDSKNPFIYSSGSEIVEKIEHKDSFIVYFGDLECPWCRSVIEQAIKSAADYDIDKIYYVRIWNGFHQEQLRDVYELRDGKAVIRSKGEDAYYQLLSYFDHLLEDYTLKDENNHEIKVHEKRILAPSFIFVKNGYASKLISGISKKQKNFNSPLSEEVIKEEKEIFDQFYLLKNLCFDAC